MTGWRRFTVWTLLWAVAGCGPARTPPAPPPEAGTSQSPVAPGTPMGIAPAPEQTVRPGQAGPVKVGDDATGLTRMPGLTAVPVGGKTDRAGPKSREWVISRYGITQMVVSERDGRIESISVFSDRYSTPAGVRPGQQARDLERAYGTGALKAGEVSFASAPGLRFRFRPVTPSGARLRATDWPAVLKQNPYLDAIILNEAPASSDTPQP